LLPAAMTGSPWWRLPDDESQKKDPLVLFSGYRVKTLGNFMPGL
jgi:hypothetical protein